MLEACTISSDSRFPALIEIPTGTNLRVFYSRIWHNKSKRITSSYCDMAVIVKSFLEVYQQNDMSKPTIIVANLYLNILIII